MIARIPILGAEVLAHIPLLEDRVRDMLKHDGLEYAAIGPGTALQIQRSGPLDSWVPLGLILNTGLREEVVDDIWNEIRSVHSYIEVRQVQAEDLPWTLRKLRAKIAVPGALLDHPLAKSASLAMFANLHRREYGLPDICSELGATKYAIETAFRRSGLPGAKHALAVMRMQQSSRLLLSTDVTIAEVSFAVGYDSHAAFDRAFKKYWGMAPNQLRSNLRSNGKAIQSFGIAIPTNGKTNRSIGIAVTLCD